MTITTRKKLADSLNRLVRKKPLDKITVQELADKAGVSRKTFYYHFQDIYDLMLWGLAQRWQAVLPPVLSKDNWKNALLSLFLLCRDNADVVQNLYHSMGRDFFADYLFISAKPLVESLANQISGVDTLLPEKHEFLLEFYTTTISSILLRWVDSGMKSDPEILVNDLISVLEGTMSYAADRLR